MISPTLLLQQDAETAALPVDPGLDDERRRKLTYVCEQISRPDRAADHKFLRDLKREIERRG